MVARRKSKKPDATVAQIGDEFTVARVLAEALPELRRADDLVCSYVQFVCGRISLERGETDWYRLAGESRIKDASSVLGALKRGEMAANDVWKIDDIVGVRVIVSTLADARDLAEFILADRARPFPPPERKDLHRADGYRAIHLKGRLATQVADIGCEIQIRTAIQDAWAVVSRAGLYGEEGGDFLNELATNLSDQLAGSDQQLDLLKKTLHKPELTRTTVQPMSSDEIV